jgi:thioredoxin-like negative regulator of GroEL
MCFPTGLGVMTISAISSAAASPVSNFQAIRQAFSQLTSALQSNDTAGAQSAFDTLSSSPLAQGNDAFAQAIQQIGQDLKSGDLADAQKVLQTLQQQQQAHGHHHHGGGAQGVSDPSNISATNTSDPSSDGNTSNETVINIQITVSPGSDNTIDIKA